MKENHAFSRCVDLSTLCFTFIDFDKFQVFLPQPFPDGEIRANNMIGRSVELAERLLND